MLNSKTILKGLLIFFLKLKKNRILFENVKKTAANNKLINEIIWQNT